MPTRGEVEAVIDERATLIEELVQDDLIVKARVTECPDGAFITMEVCCAGRKAQVLQVLDEVGARSEGLTRFYGIPFRFTFD